MGLGGSSVVLIRGTQIGMGFHISLNGCGLKTEENLVTAKAIPLSHLLLETG
jgi:Tat protein secretion system quality control protein TatD with DNase activity